MPLKSLTPHQGKVLGLSSTGKLAGMGASSNLSKLLFSVLPLATALLGVWLVVRGIASVGRGLWRGIVTKSVLPLLVAASAGWLGFVVWVAYDNLQERHVSIAAGSRTAESYALAQALETVAARHYPRIKVSILEIEGATGLLEKGVVQLAAVTSERVAGPSARSVAALTPQRVLLARSDVDTRVVYALTQTLLERGPEVADAIKNTAFRPLAAQVQKPDRSELAAAPVHPGATAFYERDKTWVVFRYPVLSALALAGLVVGGGWGWEFGRRLRRKRQGKQQAEQERQERRFAEMARAPWSFSRILRESAREEAPLGAQTGGSGAAAPTSS